MIDERAYSSNDAGGGTIADIANSGSGKSPTSKIKLLIVDDEPDMIPHLRWSLEMYGYIVDAYTDPDWR